MSSFLNQFQGYWARPRADYVFAVKNYALVFDTNVLLSPYRFNADARSELLAVLQQLQQRVWVPHQVAQEFHQRRIDAVNDRIKSHQKTTESLVDFKSKSINALRAFANRCSLSEVDKEALVGPVREAYGKVEAELDRHAKSVDIDLPGVVRDDPVLRGLAGILDGRTGSSFSESDAAEHVKSFERRAAARIPPGYKDDRKTENSHGDYFVWRQILDKYSGSDGASVLFITNDAKEDWVQKTAGFDVGARPELCVEFKKECGGDFLICTLTFFLSLVKDVLGSSVSSSTLEQASGIVGVHSVELIMPEEDVAPLADLLISLFESPNLLVSVAQYAELEELIYMLLEGAESVGDDTVRIDATDGALEMALPFIRIVDAFPDNFLGARRVRAKLRPAARHAAERLDRASREPFLFTRE